MSRLSAPLVLASASPRRRAILELLNLEFRVIPAEVDESLKAEETPEAYVLRIAELKAVAIAHGLRDEQPPPAVLGADTAVVSDGVVLGKPVDDHEARAMILRLSGRAHRVITGVAVARGPATIDSLAVATTVRFRALTEGEAERYVASGEGRDKAGAYAVQGLGAGLVASVEGSYHTVVGLPAVETLELLRRTGVLEEWP